MHLDQVVIGMGKVIHELLGSRCFHCPVFDAHVRRVGVSELDREELCG